ncbi:MAG TPA: hypothetical protein VKR54_04635 [Candidatus Babeliales bacterium]|jgi:hypothetical protein|nr:hypothetical protein [Candidatus Babeliales bacterium]
MNKKRVVNIVLSSLLSCVNGSFGMQEIKDKSKKFELVAVFKDVGVKKSLSNTGNLKVEDGVLAMLAGMPTPKELSSHEVIGTVYYPHQNNHVFGSLHAFINSQENKNDKYYANYTMLMTQNPPTAKIFDKIAVLVPYMEITDNGYTQIRNLFRDDNYDSHGSKMEKPHLLNVIIKNMKKNRYENYAVTKFTFEDAYGITKFQPQQVEQKKVEDRDQ